MNRPKAMSLWDFVEEVAAQIMSDKGIRLEGEIKTQLLLCLNEGHHVLILIKVERDRSFTVNLQNIEQQKDTVCYQVQNGSRL